MTNILVEHAKENVWQEPLQDRQFNIGLGRLTKHGGFVGSTNVLWHRVLSPTRHETTRKFHHVYQIGQISPITLNLVNSLIKDTWVSVQKVVDDFDVLIEVYFESGAIVPLDHVWVMRDFTDNLLLGVWHDKSIDYGTVKILNRYDDEVRHVKIDTDTDRLITRFYSNARQSNTSFNAVSSVVNDSVKVTSKKINTQSDYNTLITETTAIRNEFNNKGMGLWYEDGFLVTAPNGYTTTMLGKTISFVWDETYKFKQMFPIKNIPMFVSKLDQFRRKYLLLCDTVYDIIDFYDDVDFYLVSGNENKYRGIYINRSQPYSLRQVTHNAYAVDAEMIAGYMRQHEFLSGDDVYILIQVREGGRTHGVFSQRNRIDELFKLPYSSVVNAFMNTDALVDEWKAASLEESAYVKLMGAESHELTQELATAAYGYPGITQTILDPLSDVVGGYVKVPKGLQRLDNDSRQGVRSVFLYDGGGKYLGYMNNGDILDKIQVGSRFPTATRAECFRMKVVSTGEFGGIYFDKDINSNTLDEFGFRAYTRYNDESNLDNKWTDVTGKPFYTYTKGTAKKPASLIWDRDALDAVGLVGCVKVNKFILVNTYQYKQSSYSGAVMVDVTSLHDWRGEYIATFQTIPPAVVEVFADGEQLIESIDYEMKFPTIIINNTKVCSSAATTIVVRSYGCGDPKTGKPYPPIETGFVTNGFLSVDGEYDITKHRSNKVVVNSRKVDKSSVRFSEYAETGQLYPVDGRPYMVQDYIVNVEPFADKDTTTLYSDMRDVDKRLGDYLTQFLPEVPVNRPLVQTERWSLISPVVSTILHSMANGYMGNNSIRTSMTLEDFNSWFSPFEYLLDYDPAYHNLDNRYVHIRPHPYQTTMTCSMRQYQFIEQVISFYLNDRVDLTPYVEIG